MITILFKISVAETLEDCGIWETLEFHHFFDCGSVLRIVWPYPVLAGSQWCVRRTLLYYKWCQWSRPWEGICLYRTRWERTNCHCLRETRRHQWVIRLRRHDCHDCHDCYNCHDCQNCSNCHDSDVVPQHQKFKRPFDNTCSWINFQWLWHHMWMEAHYAPTLTMLLFFSTDTASAARSPRIGGRHPHCGACATRWQRKLHLHGYWW